jgi:hypothetical protein
MDLGLNVDGDRDEETMKTNWMIVGAAAMLMMAAGCDKSNNNGNQAAPGTQPSSAANSGSTSNPAAGAAAGAATGAASTSPAPPPPPPPFEVAAGTSLPIILSTKLDSKVNHAGDPFSGTLASAVLIDGEVAIPKGSPVQGEVVDAKKQGTFKGEANMAIHLTSIMIRGEQFPITSSTYAATVKGKGKRTAAVTGGGAALGALIGGLAGGGKGAAIGAGVGGGGGLAVSGTTGGENVTLAAESRVTFKLSNGITVERPAVSETPAAAPAAAPAQ